MMICDHYHHPVIYVKDTITMTMMICNHNHLLSHNDHPTIYANDWRRSRSNHHHPVICVNNAMMTSTPPTMMTTMTTKMMITYLN